MSLHGVRRCSVKGCQSTSLNHKRFHHFPKEAERSKTWTRLCGNEILLGVAAAEMHKRFRVCSLHFSREQYFSNELYRLKFYMGGAVPDQALGNPLSEELIESWWKAGTLEQFQRKFVAARNRRSKYDVSDISGMTPLPHLSWSNYTMEKDLLHDNTMEKDLLHDDTSVQRTRRSKYDISDISGMTPLPNLSGRNKTVEKDLLQDNTTLQRNRRSKYDISDISGMTPLPDLSGSNNGGISPCQEEFALFDNLDQSKPGPCASECGDEGFAPMEYLDHYESEANLEPTPMNSGSYDVGSSHSQKNISLLEAPDQSKQNGSACSLKKSSVENANAPGILGSPFEDVEASSTFDSPLEDTDVPGKLGSLFQHFNEGSAPMEYLDYVDYNESGPTPYREKCHIGALTLNDFKTERRAERSLWLVKSKFKQMQHQNRQLQQKLKYAQNKIKELESMLASSGGEDSNQE
ncbi:uncharacterized protein LOC117653562 [Thrips palmi]|uniref:Uncharacterized protein LOC117653562 n=1 Tax=Thrips palmi TaxID=161013 RepID=A0A6P9AAX4_THRPL|nr:uncharacterized protein LOC117653562 [Thrips palmi]